ncbi:TonB-dependent receptor [Rhodohalobacter sp. 614A]|uniref:TonB-dependent receptor n=1 Tax=Rhodohalobacter sp. 614A TaxID=2908649 RepID=UPI001F175DF8|nr:TonB-dependent receptor [Rhodohalobacter sp. 614A]
MLKQFISLFAVFLWTVLPFQLVAQTIEGRVTDASTGEALEGATILETRTINGTSADSEGSFELKLTTKVNEITISFVGYATKTISITNPEEFIEITLEEQVVMTGEVFVSALRVDESTPIAYSNINRGEIEAKNLGQDIPMLVQSAPSVVSTSDAGAGIGYTGIRIRGVDPGRINVTINGIPLNDAESHGVFWVNMPDMASSTQNIQIQRGVGTSTQGAGAFGATMNLQTALMQPEAYGTITTGIGSYGTRKANVQLGSGILDNGWQFEGRLSKIESDGYIDRARSDLKSFYLSGSRHGNRSLLKADVFSGQEETYQAWNGVPEPILEDDPQQLESYINNLFLGEEDAEHLRANLGNRQFNEFTYQDQTDNYQQDHYQLHYTYRLMDTWSANASLHYTYGRGYYEEFRRNDDLDTYNISPIQIGGETVSNSDLVRRRWLDNHFYGGVFSTEWKHPEEWTLTLGGGYNEYDGDHFGEVIWSRFAGSSDLGDRYYNNNAFKTDFNVYGKFNYYLTSEFNAFADLQYRTVGYEFLGLRIDDQTEDVIDVTQSDRINFLNPKFGVVYRPDEGHRMFASVSVGGKEPTRDEYVESSRESRPDPERLFDYELGYDGNFNRFHAGVNLYYMKYKDQLILTGAVNDVGGYIRENVPDSYRAGIELEVSARITDDFEWSGNATFSQNKIDEYQRFVDDYDQGGQQAETYSDVDIAFSPSTIVNSILSYNPGAFTAEWISKYVSRQYLDNTQNKARSIDSYWVNDLRFSYELRDLGFVQGITASLQINNVLDEKYVSNGYTFGWISGGEEQFFNYYYPQAGRNILANVKIQF